MTPAIVGLDVAGPAPAWRAAGFAVERDEFWIGTVRVRCAAGEKGIRSWTLSDTDGTDIDGLTTQSGVPTTGPNTHPNGATVIDHVVVWTPDDARTTRALELAGMEVRRVRDDARPGVRQTFFRAGEVIVELVAPLEADPDGIPARFFGLAISVADLDACAALLGERLSETRTAVQPGRRIATLRHRDVGLAVAVAYMSV